MYIVDTNVLSELRRKSPLAIKWFDSVESEQIYLSVITIGEIYRGIVRKQSKDAAAAAGLAAWLRGLQGEYEDRMISIDQAIATEWGRVTAKRSRNTGDSLIAATAIARKMTLVTRNVVDFTDLPVSLLNPWDG